MAKFFQGVTPTGAGAGTPSAGGGAPASPITSVVKIVVCVILAIGTISLLSFDIIDVDSFFGTDWESTDVVKISNQIFLRRNFCLV